MDRIKMTNIWDEKPEKIDIPNVGVWYDAFEMDEWLKKLRTSCQSPKVKK